MKRFVLTCLLVLLPLAAQAQELRSLTVGKFQRYYGLAVPTTPLTDTPVEKEQVAPLLIVLSGGNLTARNVWRQRDLMAPAIKAGFVVVAPEPIEQQWNDGLTNTPADDVQFISALIDHLAKANHVDTKRIYVVGASNGGRMALHLACVMADRLAGVAVVGATLPRPLEQGCKPARPLPMLILNGTEDKISPWDGAPVKTTRGMSAARMSTPQTAEFWAQKNGCIKPLVTVLPDANPTDGSVAKLALYSGCAAATVLYALDGAGHSWPGVGPLADGGGSTNKDISAGSLIIDFFAPAKKAD